MATGGESRAQAGERKAFFVRGKKIPDAIPLKELNPLHPTALEVIAELFVSALAKKPKNREFFVGGAQVSWTKFHNELVRLLFNAKNRDQTILQLQRAITAIAGGPALAQYSITEITKEYQGHVQGARYLVETVIPGLKANLQQQKISNPNLRQIIATNDHMDAAHDIDLIAVDFDPRSTVAVKTTFVQAKNGTTTTEETRRIQLEHQNFLNLLADPVAAEETLRAKQAEPDISRRHLDMSMDGVIRQIEKDTSDGKHSEAFITFAMRYIGVLESFFTTYHATQDVASSVNQATANSDLTPAEMALMLRDSHIAHTMTTIATLLISGQDQAFVKRVMIQLQAWAKERHVTAAELVVLYQHEPLPELSMSPLDSQQYVSLVYHGPTHTRPITLTKPDYRLTSAK